MADSLKKHNLKHTDKREAILDVLKNHDVPINIDTIFSEADKIISMNLSTAYRTISKLCDKDIVVKSINHNGVAYYQLNRHTHEHYLICRKCNKIVPIHQCNLQELEETLRKDTGFLIEEHHVEFVGLCPICRNND